MLIQFESGCLQDRLVIFSDCLYVQLPLFCNNLCVFERNRYYLNTSMKPQLSSEASFWDLFLLTLLCGNQSTSNPQHLFQSYIQAGCTSKSCGCSFLKTALLSRHLSPVSTLTHSTWQLLAHENRGNKERYMSSHKSDHVGADCKEDFKTHLSQLMIRQTGYGSAELYSLIRYDTQDCFSNARRQTRSFFCLRFSPILGHIITYPHTHTHTQ